MTFNDLKLSAPLLKAVSEAGYETPSPIQASAIPPVLEGRDLMGCAQTGTGKTAAFALPMLDRLAPPPPVRRALSAPLSSPPPVSWPSRSARASTPTASTSNCAAPSSSAAWARPRRWRPSERAWTSSSPARAV